MAIPCTNPCAECGESLSSDELDAAHDVCAICVEQHARAAEAREAEIEARERAELEAELAAQWLFDPEADEPDRENEHT